MKGFLTLLIFICFSCSQSATTDSNSDTPENSIEMEAATPDAEDKDEPIVTSPEGEENLKASENAPLVYVTQDGDKYHTADCRYSKTAHEVKLSQAKVDGKTACGICKPNSKTGEKQMRCTVDTADGTRCKRMTSDATGKCFQHRDS